MPEEASSSAWASLPTGFQSASGIDAGRSYVPNAVLTDRTSFNPLPASMPEEASWRVSSNPPIRFNPLPASMPEEASWRVSSNPPIRFNPLPASMPEEAQQGLTSLQVLEFQSASGIDAGRSASITAQFSGA